MFGPFVQAASATRDVLEAADVDVVVARFSIFSAGTTAADESVANAARHVPRHWETFMVGNYSDEMVAPPV